MRFTPRHQYDEQRDQELRERTIVQPEGQVLTEQHHKDSADLNLVLKRFGVTDGAIPTPQEAGFFNQAVQDFGEGITLREALDLQRRAQEHFDALPAKIRKRFGNNPLLMHEWVSDPDHAEEAVALGLLKKATPEPPAPPKETP